MGEFEGKPTTTWYRALYGKPTIRAEEVISFTEARTGWYSTRAEAVEAEREKLARNVQRLKDNYATATRRLEEFNAEEPV